MSKKPAIVFIGFVYYSLLVNPLLSQEKATLYYYAIGSEHYLDTSRLDFDFVNFSSLSSSNHSANVFKDACLKLGSKAGTILVSENSQSITKTKVLSSLSQQLNEIKKDSSTNKLLLIYYCGHGIAELETKSVFMIPSDYEYDHNRRFNQDVLRKYALSPVSLGAMITASDKNLRYFILLDCCYELAAQNTILNNLDTTAEFVRKYSPLGLHNYRSDRDKEIFFKEQEQKRVPTIFAAPPGSSIKFVTSPIRGDSQQTGPLARRFYLAIEELKDKSLMFSDLFNKLMNIEFDIPTNTAYSPLELNQGPLPPLSEIRIK